MAKRRGTRTTALDLIPGIDLAVPALDRRHDSLILPAFLSEESKKPAHLGSQRDQAHAIVIRWAELESAGHLPEYKETSVDVDFLNEIFDDALGFARAVRSPADYQLVQKYTILDTGTADGALGRFPTDKSPTVIIELKDARNNIDRDKSNGRTAVDQCWDYLYALPDCPWGIVSNFSIIRLYHRDKTKRAYEQFTLQELRDRARFDEFYALMRRASLLTSSGQRMSLALDLLTRTTNRQEDVGNKLYDEYNEKRKQLIYHLNQSLGKPLDASIRIAQKLLDRVIFIAFCEDRGLLPANILWKTGAERDYFNVVTNPIWKNLMGLFRQVDSGGPVVQTETGFNGGLFKKDDEVDTLDLADIPWGTALHVLGKYNFAQDVNVEVLGHFFEKSITELEKLRPGGLFSITNGQPPTTDVTPESDTNASKPSAMPKSAQRKRFGIYYTPPAFTRLIVERTIDAIVAERFAAHAKSHNVDPDTGKTAAGKTIPAYWRDGLATLRDLKVIDPACGSGAFLIRAYDALADHYTAVVSNIIRAESLDPNAADALRYSIVDSILSDNLHGVDLSEQAVEITQLALWLRSARKNRKLSDLSKNIVWQNSLVSDPAIHPRAMNWRTTFAEVFNRPGHQAGFDCVIGNPPWERVKLQEREFFSLTDTQTAESVRAADRRKRIESMSQRKPELFAAYEKALADANQMLTYARKSGQYPLTGKGDVNLYMLFAELARTIVAPDGIVGLLVPSGIATDETTKDFFATLIDNKELVSLYDFENRDKIFEDVDGRFKFSAIVFGGAHRKTSQVDFVFFAHSAADVAPVNKKRHITLTAADLKLLNPNTRTCPIFRSRRDADITRAIYKRIPILIDENRRQGGNPWEIKFSTMFHQTNDAEHFHPAAYWEKQKYKLQGNIYVHGKKRALPLYEAKMVQAYDHRAASVRIDDDNWIRQGQKDQTSLVQHANPEFAVIPRWWVDQTIVSNVSTIEARDWLLAYKDVTSATNERTMIAAFLPWVAVVNSAPLLLPGKSISARRQCCLLANLNAFPFDYIARQKVGSVHLNFFIVEQLPTLPPDAYADKCPWSKRETLEHWISNRVLRLTCTAEDMFPLATACNFKGSRGDGVHIWKDAERDNLRAELDAAYFHLYGLNRDDVEYVLTTFTGTGRQTEPHLQCTDSQWTPGEPGDLILKAYDDQQSCM